jgi:hypothetical protein
MQINDPAVVAELEALYIPRTLLQGVILSGVAQLFLSLRILARPATQSKDRSSISLASLKDLQGPPSKAVRSSVRSSSANIPLSLHQQNFNRVSTGFVNWASKLSGIPAECAVEENNQKTNR